MVFLRSPLLTPEAV